MTEKESHPEELRTAITEETKRFTEFYLWLKHSMSSTFFEEVNEEWISLIVHTLMGFKVQDYFSEIHLKNAAISLCLDSDEADVRILKSYPMYGIKNYTAYVSSLPLPFPDLNNKCLRIATITFTEAISEGIEPLPEETAATLRKNLKARNPSLSDVEIAELIGKMDVRFLRKMREDRQILTLEMYHRAKTRDHCQYEVQYEENWEEKETYSMHIVLAWKNTPKHNFLYRLARVVHRHGLIMKRVNATYIDPYSTKSVLLLSFGLHGASNEAAWEAADISDFLQELVTLKYFGAIDHYETTFVKPGLVRGNLANLLRTLMHFIHQTLVHLDPNLYTLDNITEGLCRHPELTVKLLEAFEAKFHPVNHDIDTYTTLKEEFVHLVSSLDTGHEYNDIRRRNILLQGINFVDHLLKTNFYRNNKTALAFRLDPKYLDHTPFDRSKLFPELPFAIFFIKGMHFISFHIRFKDLARGGLRTIYPEKKERATAEQNVIFLECYNLAYTQHKKNKDIPEGGAKGVIFLKPYERLVSEATILARELRLANLDKEVIDEKIDRFKSEQKVEYLYQTQRSFIKNFLSLINCDDEGGLRAKHIVDYWKKPEYIYLGPDENMHNSMIQWIAYESKKEHYKPGGAFISGKPKIGINHKEYGVTSLGVNVYMEEALKYLNIDPEKESFSVKISGGPDGDVAGNQLLNLYRKYPNTAKVVALTDVSGTINDPKGLDLQEIAELFHTQKPIRYYPPKKLGEGGFLLDRESKREPTPYIQQTLLYKMVGGELISEWLSSSEMNSLFRNNVHETYADVFIPAGGRPRTLKDTNYRDYLDKEGMPTSKAIVEGANLYLSPWARHYLEERGVVVIKDSSANKGGVICSSYEILCSLALSDEEFLRHKPALVAEILEALQVKAREEAKLLLATYEPKSVFLSDISDQISKRINTFTDQLLNYLANMPLSNNPKDPLIKSFLNYCPQTLQNHFQERLLHDIPDNHKKAIIASNLAARLVYRRGLKWFPSLVDIFPLILQDKEIMG